MRLQVKFLSGEGFELDVDPSIQVSTLKVKIQEKTKVPDFQQRLLMQNGHNMELQDNRRLCDYSLQPSPTVMLLVRKEERMQIFLLNDKGRTSTYDVLPSDSVRDFKVRVHRQEGVTPDQQRLVYEGKQLEDGRLLSDYNIRPHTTISLLLRLRGAWRNQVVEGSPEDRFIDCIQDDDSEKYIEEPIRAVLDLDLEMLSKIHSSEKEELYVKDVPPVSDEGTQESGGEPFDKMRLQVKFLSGEGFELDVDPSIQVSTLKVKIQEKTKVPDFQQRLLMQNGHNMELQDNRRLCDYSLQPSPTVMLLVRKEERMQIFLLNDKGRTSTYDVLPSDSVRDFKVRVHRQEGVTPDQQRLVYEGKQLEDGRLLSDYNIRPHTTISLLLRLRGG
ncbi:uncharacterized protein LOC127579192 [Pristis pectinata]|uniref:uncharacterized protein LOC127579192 n=1 Tax=Pristis pectinata TaxID=685728 RepID=UPI00223C8F85|nr:uncharacterized protein LOC127579192 [Pristis pectinata]